MHAKDTSDNYEYSCIRCALSEVQRLLLDKQQMTRSWKFHGRSELSLAQDTCAVRNGRRAVMKTFIDQRGFPVITWITKGLTVSHRESRGTTAMVQWSGAHVWSFGNEPFASWLGIGSWMVMACLGFNLRKNIGVVQKLVLNLGTLANINITCWSRDVSASTMAVSFREVV